MSAEEQSTLFDPPYFKKGESLFYLLSSEGENLLNYKKEVEVSYKDGSF